MNFKKLLKNEFVSGKKWYDWMFLAVGLVLQFAAIIAGFINGTPDSVGLIISGISGVLSVVLCSQGKISFYIFGYIQLLTYVFCFSIPNNLHGETIENIMYFVTMLIGLYVWFKRYKQKSNTEEIEVKAKKLGWKGNLITALIFVVGSIIYGIFLKNVPMFGQLDSDPWLDSVTSIPAYIAQYFMVLGYREQWIYWLILDVFSVALSWRAHSWVMTAQFIFWCINCVYGWLKWTKSAKYENYKEID